MARYLSERLTLLQHIQGQKIDTIACIDARGFLIGAALAYKIGCGLVPIRKKGNCPGKFTAILCLEYDRIL